MTVITITRKAKCTDCAYFERTHIPATKIVRHICVNSKSPRYGKYQTLKDWVCAEWSFVKKESEETNE